MGFGLVDLRFVGGGTAGSFLLAVVSVVGLTAEIVGRTVGIMSSGVGVCGVARDGNGAVGDVSSNSVVFDADLISTFCFFVLCLSFLGFVGSGVGVGSLFVVVVCVG
jgi:hypothetical protein